MREAITTALDVLGLLLVAAGIAFWLWPYIGGASLVVSGALVIAASAFSDSRKTRARNGTDQ